MLCPTRRFSTGETDEFEDIRVRFRDVQFKDGLKVTNAVPDR